MTFVEQVQRLTRERDACMNALNTERGKNIVLLRSLRRTEEERDEYQLALNTERNKCIRFPDDLKPKIQHQKTSRSSRPESVRTCLSVSLSISFSVGFFSVTDHLFHLSTNLS